jgi:hypothetical protein
MALRSRTTAFRGAIGNRLALSLSLWIENLSERRFPQARNARGGPRRIWDEF